MSLHRTRLVPIVALGGLMLLVTAGAMPAQQLARVPLPGPVAAQPGDPDGVPPGAEVMARGPIHEAYASTAEQTGASPVIAKQPPEAIEELPPDQKPEGDNVQWMPGYWHYDDEEEKFIWISGFWRSIPPGRIWVPGSWRQVRGGWQWVPGFWQEPDPQQPQQPEIEYLPAPPASIEIGPSVVAPTMTSFYTPGSWVWRGRYVWRPGAWIEYRPNWVWVPAHFRWTPVGYVFVNGFWDHTLATRGVLFAPIAFSRPIYLQPAFVYTPVYVVSEPAMFGAMFVRRGWGNYFWGDYFAARYTTIGFTAWCGTVGPRGGFAIGFGAGRAWGYDPLWSHYSVAFRHDRAWAMGFNNLYDGRYRGTIAAPPRTLIQQNTVINKITNVNVQNVTNNITVINKNVRVNNKNVTEVAMVAPIKVARDLQPETRIQAINARTRKMEAQHANQVREVGIQRTKLENAVLARGPATTKTDATKKLKLDVPRDVVARSQVTDLKRQPPPNPHGALKDKINPKEKIDPKLKVDPKLKIDPKVDPNKLKVDPKLKIDPKVDPNLKIDPRLPVSPYPMPRIDPKSKIDPKLKIDPKGDPKLKINPKLPVSPFPSPRIDPKGKIDPKIDPKGKKDLDPPPVKAPPVVRRVPATPRVTPPMISGLPSPATVQKAKLPAQSRIPNAVPKLPPTPKPVVVPRTRLPKKQAQDSSDSNLERDKANINDPRTSPWAYSGGVPLWASTPREHRHVPRIHLDSYATIS